MKKQLSELSLKELWELFPIILTPHNECWKGWYREEHKRISACLPLSDIARIEHIGSTAVNGIAAKPTVDILVELKEGCSFEQCKTALIANGYVCMSETANRISFNKGYTPEGFAEKVFHLHLRKFGDHDELYFRDYLNDHFEVAKEYENLKLMLWKQYEHNRDAYTEAKTEFIIKYTLIAKDVYKGCYAKKS